jgi:hypothetical protein
MPIGVEHLEITVFAKEQKALCKGNDCVMVIGWRQIYRVSSVQWPARFTWLKSSSAVAFPAERASAERIAPLHVSGSYARPLPMMTIGFTSLFPLYGARWFGGDVIHHSVDAWYLVYNAR